MDDECEPYLIPLSISLSSYMTFAQSKFNFLVVTCGERMFEVFGMSHSCSQSPYLCQWFSIIYSFSHAVHNHSYVNCSVEGIKQSVLLSIF